MATDTVPTTSMAGIPALGQDPSGDLRPLAVDTGGNVLTVSAGGGAGASAMGDNESNATEVTRIGARLEGFDGTDWDRLRTALTTVSSTLTGVLNTLPWAVYNATPTARTEGQGGPLQASTSGAVKANETDAAVAEDNPNGVLWTVPAALTVTKNSWSRTSSSSAGVGTAGVSIKASLGRVRLIRVTNAHGTVAFYIQLHNKATAAVNNDVPVDRALVPALGTATLDYGAEGMSMATGISIAASTTINLLTLLGAADAHYMIEWL